MNLNGCKKLYIVNLCQSTVVYSFIVVDTLAVLNITSENIFSIAFAEYSEQKCGGDDSSTLPVKSKDHDWSQSNHNLTLLAEFK